METVRRVRAGLDTDKALIGFAGGPFTVACYMLDGKGGGSFARTRQLAYEDRGLVEGVIELLEAASIAYLQGQVDAGADCVMAIRKLVRDFAFGFVPGVRHRPDPADREGAAGPKSGVARDRFFRGYAG